MILKSTIGDVAESQRINLSRRKSGLKRELLDYLNLQKGHVVTLNQSDRFERNGKTADVVKCGGYF